MKYKVLDLFCGAGGLSLGFKNAGFEIIGGVDFDSAAMDTHKHNFESNFEYCGDISEIDDSIIDKLKGKVDVIIGGPPCQGFSSANRQSKEDEDPRNKLFFQYIRFVKNILPKAFLIENVPGILSRDNGYAKDKIIKITSELGYNVSVKVLKASDYGVPQKRARAFFVGIRKDYDDSFNFENLKSIFPTSNVEDAIKDLEIIENGDKLNTLLRLNELNPLQSYFVSNEKNIYNHDISIHNEKVIERIKHVPQGGNWKDVPEELWDTKRNNRHSSAYRRLKYSDASITIDTGHMNYFHPIFNRVPTVRESARIQTFQDSFVFKGTKTQQFRQVGNAVPPILAQTIAIEIKKILKGE